MTGIAASLFKKAFLRDVDVANLGAPEPPDPETLQSDADEAWRANRRSDFLRSARALWAAGRRYPKLIVRMGAVLTALGLFEEALEVLSSLPAPSGKEVDWSCGIAKAALAAGMQTTAEAAITSARRCASTESELRAVEDVSDLARGPSESSRESWEETRSWVVRHLNDGQPALAGAALASGVARLSAEAADADVEDICDAARAVMRVADGQTATSILTAMASLFERHGERGALRATLAAMRGRPFQTALARPESADEGVGQILRSCLAQACAAAQSWPAAIERFETPVKAAGLLALNSCELARCVGKQVIAQNPLVFTEPGPPRIYDMFPFNGEFVMLEMKLAEMGPWVDKFILVEASETFSGKPKPLYFAENRERFAAFADKIVYVRVDRFPEYLTSPWAREFYQRDCGLAGLQGLCAGSDLVIISDVDEIIREEAVRGLTEPLTGADFRLFNYFLNLEVIAEGIRVKSMFVRARLLSSAGPSYLRHGHLTLGTRASVSDAGWHFSTVGSASEMARMFASYSHVEWAHLDESRLAERLERVRRKTLADGFARRELDESFPAFILQNRERLKELLI